MKNHSNRILPYCMLLICSGILHGNNETNDGSFHLKTIFELQRDRFAGFLDNVLRQTSSTDFYAEADKIILQENPSTDAEYYSALLKHRSNLTPALSPYYQTKLLSFQKDLLSDQAMSLLDKHKKYTRCVEIGTPGTYLSALRSTCPSIENICIINDRQRLSDHLQAFAFRPFNQFLAYDRFIPLNDYEPINKAIESNSIDLVVCFIGLHHIPANNIESFVASIARILKPNGTFLLRDHDCINAQTESLIYGAHSIYNIVIPGEPEEAERTEYRNFQPLDYWISLLEAHGLQVGSERIVQNGDPSLNTMIRCTKIAQTPQEHIIDATQKISERANYKRDIVQSYLNAPEWFNVDISQEYGNFINHTPFYAFPYFKSIASYWHIYLCSIKAAAKKRGLLTTLSSSYNLMNMFVGISMSIEYAAKGLMSLPIGWMYNGDEPVTLQLLVHDPHAHIDNLDERIEVLETYGNDTIKLIQVPRYKQFLDVIRKIISADIDIVEVSGNKEIACKVRYPIDANTINFAAVSGCTLEYTWQIPSQNECIYAVLTLEFKNIKEIISYCNAQHVEILYFHDY